MPKDIDVVVLGLSPTGLYAIREASRGGYRVFGIGAPRAPGSWSRLLEGQVTAKTPEGRVSAILELFPENAEKKPVLIVTSDQDLEAVAAQSKTLSKHVHLQHSYKDGLALQIMDKSCFYKMCDVRGVSYPEIWSAVADEASVYRDQICYPSMIKPARIHDVKHLMMGKKGWIVNKDTDFDGVISRIPPEAGTLLIQEIVPGPESNITLWCGYIDQEGRVRQRFTARKLRQYPPGFGSASLVQSETCSETSKIAEGLLSKLGYRGIAAAEFKRHPETGELKIIEINPRPSLWFSVASKAGVFLVETAMAEALGKALPPMQKQKDGVLWSYSLKDLASRLFYFRNKGFVLPAPDMSFQKKITAKTYAVASWNDPMPSVAEWMLFAAKSRNRLFSKIKSKE